MSSVFRIGVDLRSAAVTASIAFLYLFLQPATCGAVDVDLEKSMNKSLAAAREIVDTMAVKLARGASVEAELSRLRKTADDIKTNSQFLEERFKQREEKAKSLGTKAVGRHRHMVEGYRKALGKFLGLVESLTPDSTRATVDSLKTILDKVIPKKKRPIIGILPYKHLNYPAQTPGTAPAITPAFKGGNKTVTPADTAATDEAPLSNEIAALAQGLNWNPVSIYEYVKNNIETEWYWGCMKGAEETLHQRSGNDCDQAALLAALLRASGFPARYVRGVIQFFPDIERAKNLAGIDDPVKIAEFFQKAGVPYTPVIAGGKIANFQIEHVWVESRIPYANYRGVVIDDSGKVWLGLDTSIKVKGYTYNNAPDILQEPVAGSLLSGIRDEYLGLSSSGTGNTPFELNQTPLEYLEDRIDNSAFGIPHSAFLRARTLVPEILNILPASMQFTLVKATDEYTAIPDELSHKVKLSAVSAQPSANTDKLFETTLPLYKLGNQQIALSYEPETIQDQEIIDSYGGLDNTPAYLVRLRPVLKVNGERIIVGQDGLPMGSEYELTIELIAPNGTDGASSRLQVEKIVNTMIIGNLTVIGIVAQKAVTTPSPLAGEACTEQGECGGGEGAKDAERLLYEAAQHYIDRWNQAEDELASLLHLAVVRPLPAVVTLGGTIDVTYLLDMPHGFEWKGVFVDADLRTIEAVHRIPDPGDRTRLFMQLSSLQGSILESRIFEDDFQAESISTAKLFQLATGSAQLVTINKSNIDTVLPTLPFDDNVKEDMINAVNQDYELRTPNSELVFNDWSGIGYLKENTATGESGWMLSGMIAGGMTAVRKEQWINQDLAAILNQPNTRPPNPDPNSVTRIVRMSDYQTGFAGETVAVPCQARAEDAAGRPVKNVLVTFRVIAGGGRVQGVDGAGNVLADALSSGTTPSTAYTVETGPDGIARVKVRLGEKIDDSPYYRQETAIDSKRYWELEGLNTVSISTVNSASAALYTDKPFEAYARAGAAAKVEVVSPKTLFYGAPNTLASSAWVKVADQYGNSISGKNIKFFVERTFLGADPGPDAKTARLYGAEAECPGISTLDCSGAKEYTGENPLVQFVEHFGAMAYVILGNTENTRFTVKASAQMDTFNSFGQRVDMNVPLPVAEMVYQTRAKAAGAADFAMTAFAIYQFDEAGNRTDAGLAGRPFPEKLAVSLLYHEEGYQPAVDASGSYFLKGTGVFTTRKVTNGQVVFKPALGGGQVIPSVSPAGADGFYSTNLTLGLIPAPNVVSTLGSASIAVPTIDTATGIVSSTTRTLSAETAFSIWGVKPNVTPGQLVLLNSEGYPVNDTEIRFSVEPGNYTYSTKSLYLDFYEKDTLGNESWMGFVQADPSGKIILTTGGTKFNPAYTYSVQLVVDRGRKTMVVSEKVALRIIQFRIVRPTRDEKILIKNDANGNPKMPTLTAQVELRGTGVDPAMINSQKICWKFKVEYNVNITKPGAEYRSRTGLNTTSSGNGTDGFLIPSLASGQPECLERYGPTFVLDETGGNGAQWGDNFGGGVITITAKTAIEGIGLSDTYTGAIQAQKNGDDGTDGLVDSKFKEYICKYLEAPTGVANYQSEILDVLGHNKVFRIISYHESAHTYAHFERLNDGNWKNLGPVLGYSPDYVFPLLNKSGNWSSPKSDGGFGLMQLTIPAPTYLQIWNWKENINGGVNLIKDKIGDAQDDLSANPPFTDAFGKSILRMETYFRYGPSYKNSKGVKTYWVLNDDGKWVFSTEDWLYADTLRAIEDAVDAGNYTLTDPNMILWKYPGE